MGEPPSTYTAANPKTDNDTILEGRCRSFPRECSPFFVVASISRRNLSEMRGREHSPRHFGVVPAGMSPPSAYCRARIVAAEASCTEMLAEQPSSAQFPGDPPRNARTPAHSCAFRDEPGIPAGSGTATTRCLSTTCGLRAKMLAVPGIARGFRSFRAFPARRPAKCSPPASLTHDSADPIIPGPWMSCDGATG